MRIRNEAAPHKASGETACFRSPSTADSLLALQFLKANQRVPSLSQCVLQIAQVCKKHDTIGQDLVAMCVNDILAQGAEPLFFLDYFACGKLDVEVAQGVIAGIAEACKKAGCALLGMNMLLEGYEKSDAIHL